MIQRYTNIHRIFFLIIDLIILNVLFLVISDHFMDIYNFEGRELMIINLVSNILWLLCSYILAIYLIYRQVNLNILAVRTLGAFVSYSLVIVLFIYFTGLRHNLSLIGYTTVGFGLFLIISRLFLIAYVFYTRANSRFYHKAIIIGYNATADSLANSFSSSHSHIKCLGCFDDSVLLHDEININYLGKIEDSLDFAKANRISDIYCTLSPEQNPHLYELAELAEKYFMRFKFVPDIHQFMNRKAYLDFVDEVPVFSLRSEPMNYVTAQFKKRMFDIFISFFVITLILSWLLPILAIIIKLDSKGPVFFKQRRGGKNNKGFVCIKLRTLRENTTQDGTDVQVKLGDDRLTKVGRFFRKTNLDELPQFFNVLVGNMSVVGARPHMLLHDIRFADIENNYLIRQLSKPGVTGWAQINGLRGEIKENSQLSKRVAHDIWYIEHWNTWLDLKIIWLTVHKMVKGDKNAY